LSREEVEELLDLAVPLLQLGLGVVLVLLGGVTLYRLGLERGWWA